MNHLVERLEHGVVREHAVRRAVKLDEVERGHRQVLTRAIVPCEERVAVVVLGHVVDAAPHLRRYEHVWVTTVQLTAELLAAAVAVDIGGVEKGDAGIDRGLQRLGRVLGCDIAPVCAELPGAKTDDAHIPAEALHRSFLHVHILSSCLRHGTGRMS